ncbi:hypothetical protein DVK02_06630 [Halobellus sp. Atlit-31R]|nr:hypothetical protein DVK02_06630 [Halobellus sp. Atlit-31R]
MSEDSRTANARRSTASDRSDADADADAPDDTNDAARATAASTSDAAEPTIDGPGGSSRDLRTGRTRRRFLGTAAAGLTVGLAGCGSALSGGSGSDGSAVDVVLAGAPNGLQKYQCLVEQDGDAPITGVEPGLVGGEEFQVVNGGVKSASVVVRAADLSESVGAFEGPRTLFTLTFGADVDPTALSLNVSTATDDGGESIPADRLRLTAAGGSE